MSNVRAVVRNLTLGGTSSVLVQEYLENNLDEEKRVWYVDGKILGVCRKRFEGKRFPPRLARKNCAIATHLEPSEQAACERLGMILQRLNIRIAGVDLIDARVTDINVTSPGLLVELEQAQGVNLAARIIVALESSALADKQD